MIRYKITADTSEELMEAKGLMVSRYGARISRIKGPKGRECDGKRRLVLYVFVKEKEGGS